MDRQRAEQLARRWLELIEARWAEVAESGVASGWSPELRRSMAAHIEETLPNAEASGVVWRWAPLPQVVAVTPPALYLAGCERIEQNSPVRIWTRRVPIIPERVHAQVQRDQWLGQASPTARTWTLDFADVEPFDVRHPPDDDADLAPGLVAQVLGWNVDVTSSQA